MWSTQIGTLSLWSVFCPLSSLKSLTINFDEEHNFTHTHTHTHTHVHTDTDTDFSQAALLNTFSLRVSGEGCERGNTHTRSHTHTRTRTHTHTHGVRTKSRHVWSSVVGVHQLQRERHTDSYSADTHPTKIIVESLLFPHKIICRCAHAPFS